MTKPINLDAILVNDLGDKYNIGGEQDLFGLEVELEGKKIVTELYPVADYWKIHQDGSLRANKLGSQACEYVFRHPLSLKGTEAALKALIEYLTETPGVEVFDSYRTSIHVHVNCLNESIRTIVNFITLSIIFDELFVSQNGETRIGNNFCLRSRDAEGQIADLIQSVSKYGSLYNLAANDRYSSVNMSGLLKFGTVEFRSLECTTDLNRIMHWVKSVQALKVSARGYENPREIIGKFSRKGPLGFMISHLGDQSEKYTQVPGAHQMLQNGMRLAQDFAYCSDWQLPSKEQIEAKAVKPRVKKVGLAEYQDINWVQPPVPHWAQPPQHMINYWAELAQAQVQVAAQANAQQVAAAQAAQPQPPQGNPLDDNF